MCRRAGSEHVPVLCPVCSSAASEYCHRSACGSAWTIDRCLRCGHGWCRPRPSQELLDRVYRESAHLSQENGDHVRRLSARRDCRSWTAEISKTVPPGKVLDVGCGDGLFCWHLQRCGFDHFDLLDMDRRQGRLAQRRVGGCFYATTFEDFQPPDRYRLIIMSQVLEHAVAPIEWLRKANELLLPRGVLAVAVPNFRGAYSLLGSRDPFLTPPVHLNFFTPVSLRAAFRLAGLQVLSCRSYSWMNMRSARRSLLLRTAQNFWNACLRPLLDVGSSGILVRALATKGEGLGGSGSETL